MYNILYVESGLNGGGSFESLYQHLKFIDRSKFNPFVLFINKTKYIDLIRALDIPCYIVFDFLYSKEILDRKPHVTWLIERMRVLVDLFLPFLSLAVDKALHYFSIKEILGFIEANNIEIIHTNNQVNRDLYAVECGKISGIACVCHLRSFFSLGFNTRKAAFVNKHVSKFIAYSNSVSEYWVSNGLDPVKVEVVNNAIEDLAVSPENLHEQYKLHHSAKIIGIVGSIIPVRGHEYLINAFAKLADKMEDVYLLIVGGGESSLTERLKKMSTTLGISSRIIFTGQHPNVKKVIASLDVLVLPYSIEPFGRVLLEAWQLKTPVVLTNVGHICKIVRNNIDAVLVEYGDVEGMKESLFNILTDNNLRDSIVNVAYQTCRDRFSIDEYSKKIEIIYENILKHRHI